MNGLFARSTRVAVVAGAVALAACGGPEGSVRVTIPPGATVGTAADSLARAQVIGAPSLFRLYARLTKRDRNLKPGTYLLRRDASWNSILSSLVEGRGIVFTVTIPEGLQVATMAPILERELKVPPESLAAAAADSALRERLKVPTPTLEGYLFPETYVFQEGVTAQDVVRTMVREFERRWKPEWDVRLLALKMSRHEIVTLASIIEKEAQIGRAHV